jgi:hypothetical protein
MQGKTPLYTRGMPQGLRKIGSDIIWLGGFNAGLQAIVYLLSGGLATLVAATTFLLQTPLPFRVALFLGVLLVAFGCFNHLISRGL